MSTEETPAPAPLPWVAKEVIEKAREIDANGYPRTTHVFVCKCTGEGCGERVTALACDVLRGAHGDTCPSCAMGNPPKSKAAWMEACPARFQAGEHKTQIDHREFPRAAYGQLKAAMPATGNLTRNIILVGDTGGGKSRMLWLAAYELMVRRKVPTRCLRGTDFREQLVAAYRDEDADPEAYLAGLKNAPLLIWDDFGQDTLRSGTLSDLRAVIDARYNEGLPTFITTNYPEADLMRRLVSNAGGESGQSAVAASIARRLWEEATVIKV